MRIKYFSINIYFKMQVIINISTKSCELFKICTDLGYIDYMVTELETDDILYQMNILELLSRLAVQAYGINYLVESKALDKIAERIVDLRGNPLGNLLTPGKTLKNFYYVISD